MLDHVSAKVSDVPAAKSFYEQLFAPLGVSLMMDGAEEGRRGFGTGSGIPQFWITNTEGRGATVDAFYEAAIAAGGKDNGPPGLRSHYHENYYGAFVHDADGNNIEAVCHKPE